MYYYTSVYVYIYKTLPKTVATIMMTGRTVIETMARIVKASDHRLQLLALR